MFFAAAEERGDNLLDGRGDAYCGMLNASYNLKLYHNRKSCRWIKQLKDHQFWASSIKLLSMQCTNPAVIQLRS